MHLAPQASVACCSGDNLGVVLHNITINDYYDHDHFDNITVL